MRQVLFFALLAGSTVATRQGYGQNTAAADDDDFDSKGGGGYGQSAAAAPAYHAPMVRTQAAYHAPVAQVAAYGAVQELHIHPACSDGGPTPERAQAAGDYRKLGGKVSHRKLVDYIENSKRSLFEDDLEEPFDDPGCGHGVCVLARGGRGECICDAAFMTTPESGPCGQHQKSQGVAFILQLFLGFFGAGAFYLGGGWMATGVVCLLCGALGVIVAPLVMCLMNGLFNTCCQGASDRCNCGLSNTTTACCVGFLQCVAVIVWFVSLVIIGSDCKVDGIPCVPM